MILSRLLMLACGIFSICGGYYNWDFFFESYRAKPFIKMFGREGARKFYIGLGVFIILVSLMI